MCYKEDIINQTRFLILNIASHCIRNNSGCDLTNLIKILSKNSTGNLRLKCQKLLKENNRFLNKETWYLWICQELSIDHEENLSLL